MSYINSNIVATPCNTTEPVQKRQGAATNIFIALGFVVVLVGLSIGTSRYAGPVMVEVSATNL